MNDAELPEQRFAAPGYNDMNHPAVRRSGFASKKSDVAQAIYELDDGVVTQMKPRREIRDGRWHIRRKALHAQEELVLLGLNPGIPCGGLAETEEVANLVAELCKELVVDGLAHRGKLYRITIGIAQAEPESLLNLLDAPPNLGEEATDSVLCGSWFDENDFVGLDELQFLAGLALNRGGIVTE